MKTIIRLLIVAFLFLNVTEVRAEKVKMADKKSRTLRGTTAGCTPSSTFAWLNINNARVRVNAGGDMWWDLPGGTGAKYYIPASSSSTSLYAGSLWIAGLDINQQLKCAAIRFRQTGNDFWTGPLTIDGTASIDPATCMEYDKMYTITRAEVDDFLANCDPATGVPVSGYEIPSSIVNWPAHGDPSRGMSYYLAPFYDNDGDGHYNPAAGDYPYYDVDNELCPSNPENMGQEPRRTYGEELEGSVKGSMLSDQVIKGDQTLWWVFNDRGNAHTETGGSAIGLEIRAQAFAFATNDEINNMTFYSYEIINRSTYTLTNTYFSPWTDVDLGFSRDDFVGCDVSRGLGYGYNGKNIDGSGEPEAYGSNPPAVGVDFFQGPYLDPDGIDNPKYNPVTGENCDESINGVNFGNGIVDDERFGMRRFVYHDNTSDQVKGDPGKASEYYLFLRGIWKNGDKMHYGGDAVPGHPGVGDVACDFMFPFDSDPCNWGTGGIKPDFKGYWSEETGNDGKPNSPYDRRFMQSAGPFTLTPGAVNYITFGVPWARSSAGTAWASVELLRRVDDKCQALFDNCFKVLEGPDAPDLTFCELDRELIVYISNSKDSNNAGESYSEIDQQICGPLATDSTQRNDSVYRFEGYIVYQLANKDVSPDEYNDISKARIVYQCDVKNGVSEIINFVYDDKLQASVPTLMVEGADNGINTTFVLTQDAFTTTGDVNLINNKTYYYSVIAYAYNNYQDYEIDPNNPIGLFGQKTPYLVGRKNIEVYSVVPHKTVDGTVVNSNYGDKLQITRWAGLGNGGNQLELTQETIDEIMSKKPVVKISEVDGKKVAVSDVKFGDSQYPVAYHPTYKVGYGPIDVKVIDPLNVKTTDYALWFDNFERKRITHVTGENDIMGDTASMMAFKWYLKDLNTGEVFEADNTSELQTEKIFAERGISVSIHQVWTLGPTSVGKYFDSSTDESLPEEQRWKSIQKILAENNGLIKSYVTYADSSNKWLSGIRDDDNMPASALNWIRSGMYANQESSADNDYLVSSSTGGSSIPWDPEEAYESIAEGTWAPLILTNASRNSGQFVPGPMYNANCRVDSIFRRLGSIDIVLTADKSKWTRCPVFEMGLDKNLTEGGVSEFRLRNAPSIDKDGNPCPETVTGPSANEEDPNYIAARGMGWFPGYAIDIETGARLNMCYGEDSYYQELNGRDMMFNPPALRETTVLSAPIAQLSDPALFDPIDNTAVMGGKHFVYIFPMNDAGLLGNANYKISYKSPAYDAGAYLYNTIDAIEKAPSSSLVGVLYKSFWGQPLWAGMPMPIEGKEWLPEGNPVTISVRVATPYRSGYGNFALENEEGLYDTNEHKGYKPYYTFSTVGKGTEKGNLEKAEEDLNLITVVPNPYYAFSTYEDNALTHKVKITNLPKKCVVTIYTVNGAKIRQFKKDSDITSIDWDLTNFANTPIASGFYIIHVKDNTTGMEKTVKFYAAMRQVDLNTF